MIRFATSDYKLLDKVEYCPGVSILGCKIQ